jgi:hypothetical protein
MVSNSGAMSTALPMLPVSGSTNTNPTSLSSTATSSTSLTAVAIEIT